LNVKYAFDHHGSLKTWFLKFMISLSLVFGFFKALKKSIWKSSFQDKNK
jgi:hypothetical protein